MSLRFHFVLSDVHPGIEDFICKRLCAKMLLCVPRNGKALLRASASCSKKDVPWKCVVGVCGISRRRQKCFLTL